MDDFPVEIADDIEAALLAMPMQLPDPDPGVDLDEALEDARWQTAVCRSIVYSIEEEIEQVRAAPEMDEREIERLTEDLREYSRLYLMAALDAARLLEQWRRLQGADQRPTSELEEASHPAFTLLVVPHSRAELTPSETESPLVR